MTQKIFRNIILTVICAAIVIIGLFFNVMYQEFLGDLETNLQQELVLLERGYEEFGVDYFDGVDISQRITVIAADGTVIYDSRVDASTSEDHSDREEVIEAINNTWGYARRYSKTLGDQSIYVAKLLDSGEILRVSTDTASAYVLFLRMSSHILWIFIIVMIVSFFVAKRLSLNIVKPINDIDLNDLGLAPYKELDPLFTKLHKQAYTIDEQVRELSKRQAELELVLQNMNEGIVMINKEAKILTYNRATLALFGLGPLREGATIYEIYRSQDFMRAVDAVLSSHKQDLKISHDGKILEVIMGPITDQDGSVYGATIIIFDITQKEVQEQLRHEFSANVSHELKTPLTTVSGFAELMKNGLVDEKDVTDIAGNIYDEAQRLISLIDDIIHLSSLDDGPVEHEKEDVDLLALTRSIFAHQGPRAQKRDITLEVRGEAIHYQGTYSILEELIGNLVDNAIKYGKDHGHVMVDLKKDEDEVTIVVRDDGIGIPPESLDRIFERFYRVDKSRSKELGGTGLGLSIVKHAASYHGGKVTVESSDKGSTFTVTLPIDHTS